MDKVHDFLHAVMVMAWVLREPGNVYLEDVRFQARKGLHDMATKYFGKGFRNLDYDDCDLLCRTALDARDKLDRKEYDSELNEYLVQIRETLTIS